jgi:uncharacterized phage protein gp47/JayE
MSDFGITDEGFIKKDLDTIQQEIIDSLRSKFGNNINTAPESVFGGVTDIMSEREALIWELAEATYNSQYPESAEGVSLDNVASITALTRLPALPSLIFGQALFGTASTVIPQGTIFSVENNSLARFVTLAEVILGVGTDEIQDISFSGTPTSGSFELNYLTETTIVINWDDTNTEVEDALNALDSLSGVTVTGSFAAGFTVTFAGSDGKQPQPLLTVSNNTLDDGAAVTVDITETTSGVYQATVDCQAESTGPTLANAKTLTVIETPIGGLNTTFNPEDASLGRNIESDSEFRLRRRNRLQISLSGPTEAIRTAILQLNEVPDSTQLEDVIVIENITIETNPQGLPPKSVRAIVYQVGGSTDRDQEIAEALYFSKSGGIQTSGSVGPLSVIDSQGISHDVFFERPTEVDIYLELDLTTNSDYPTDGDTQVENLMVSWGNGLGTGKDVIVYPSLVGQLDSIPGITDVVVRIGKAASPTLDDNIIIDDGSGGTVEISRWDTSRIEINP